jgi:hypothetical protein
MIMNSVARHTIAFGRVFTLIFLLVSSGFTTVLHICAKKASECRETSGASNQDAYPNKQLSPRVTGMSVHNVDHCDRNAVVGGFYVFRTLLEKDSKAQIVEVRSLLPLTFDSPTPSTILSWFNYSYSESVSPPSVEKYVLNATLLI